MYESVKSPASCRIRTWPRFYSLPLPFLFTEHVCEDPDFIDGIFRCGQIIVTLSGSGNIFCNRKMVECGPGSAAFVYPESPESTCIRSKQTPWHYISIQVAVEKTPFITEFNRYFGEIFRLADLGAFVNFCRALFRRAENGAILLPPEQCMQLWTDLYTLLFSGHPSGGTHEEPSLGRKAGLLLELSDCDMPAASIASELGVSPAKLSKAFQEEFGEKLRDVLLRRKLSLAKAMLSGSRLTEKEIAARLGFSHAANFSRAFKKACGVSPRDFRHSPKEHDCGN